jgi:hypothetical protein
MTHEDIPDSIRRELRTLKLWATVSTVAIGALLLAAIQAPQTQRFDVLEVERLDVLNGSGTLALSIAGQGRLPGPTFGGTEYPQELSGGRTIASGMIFFNERGDEVGGLTYHGDLTDVGHRAAGGITFDQFRQDQVVSLRYSDDGRSRSAGVDVWDRSTEVAIEDLLPLLMDRREATGAARDSIDAVLQEMASEGLAAHRIFLGSADRTALLLLKDRAGRPRLRLLVDSLDVPRLEFLDAEGEVVHRVPN